MKWKTEETATCIAAGILADPSRNCTLDDTVVEAIMTRAVELKAASETMTAEQISGLREWSAKNEGCHPANVRMLLEHADVLGARNAVLEADLNTSAAEVGRLTSLLAEREGADILNRNAIRLQRERANAAETERNNAWAVASRLEAAVEEQFQEKTRLQNHVTALETDLAEARAAIARLTAVGQALSEHVDRTVGQCANPDPTTGPTCVERGCEGRTCQYPKVNHAPRTEDCSASLVVDEEYPPAHIFHCPARKP